MQTSAADTPQTTGGYCSWHQLYSRTAVPVQAFPGKGPGAAARVLYACLPCRRVYDLAPLSDAAQHPAGPAPTV